LSITLIVFLVVYLGMILGRLPGLKMDRASVALGGAVVLLALGELDQAAAIATIDFGTLGMLFGLMLVSVQLQTAGLYAALSALVARIQASQVMLLGLLVGLVGVLSAFLTNDVVAVAMTPVVLAIALRRGMNPVPFLLAIALAANAGSVATIIGSPQNMLIAQRLDLGFSGYLVYALVPALLSLLVVWAVLALIYRGRWALQPGDAPQPDALPDPSFDRWETIKGLLVLLFFLYSFVFTEWDRGMVARQVGDLEPQGPHLRHQGVSASRPQHQCVGKVVDVLGGACEVQEILERTGLRAVTELLADVVLDRLHVVVGLRLDRLDALGVVEGEVVDEVVEDVLHHRGQRLEFRQRRRVGEALQPANLDQHAEPDQAVLAQNVAEIVDLVGIASVGRRECS